MGGKSNIYIVNSLVNNLVNYYSQPRAIDQLVDCFESTFAVNLEELT